VKIIGATERLAERRGVKILIVGPTGVGKTSLLRTFPDPARVLFAEGEAGDLSVQDLLVDTIRINDWPTARNLACRIGGPNPSFAPTSCYSQAHYEAVGGPLENLDRYDVIFVDSITAISRLSFRWAEQQPESFSRSGAKDARSAYGLHGRELLLWLHQLQHARDKHVVFVGILEKVVDEFNRSLGFRVQMEGAKVPREIGGIVDEFIVMDFLDFGDGKPPVRGFITSSPNRWGFPAKDRSGLLDQVEPPNLGALIAKLTRPGQRKPHTIVPPEQSAQAT
jgi:DNA polymerase III delta prime subunit